MFYTQFVRPEPSYEVSSGEEIVEKVGYVPSNILIENMIYAGARLDQARSDMYDFPDEESIDFDFIDPTRKPGFDPADASNIAMSVSNRLSEQKKIYEKEKAKREEDEKKQYKLWQEEKLKTEEVLKK